MISISPPLGHGPVALLVQNAGQVAHPSGICDKSRTMTESSYDFLDWIRTLSRPLAFAGTTLKSSARITNVLSDAV